MKTLLSKNVLIHLLALLVFIAINGLYFYPQTLGYKLKQHDYTTSMGMSKECHDYRNKFDSEPLWTNSMFGGMPAYQITMKNSSPVNTIKNYVLKVIPQPMGYMFLLMIGFYILLLCANVRKELAIIGAIAFGLSSYNILYLAAGHNSKIHAISFIAPIIGGIVYAYKKNFRIGSAIVAVFMCLHITANHLQMTYYMLYLVMAIALIELYIHLKRNLFPKFIKASSFLLLGAVLGIIPPIANLIVTKEYSEFTTRGKSELSIQKAPENAIVTNNALDKDYIKQYSLGFGEVWSVAIPNVKGGKMGLLGQEKDLIKNVNPNYRNQLAQFPKYWGEQYATGGAIYFGASIFILFILGVFFIKDRLKWAFVASSILSIALSWKYGLLTDIFIEYIPLFNKFRDTKMMLILVQISFAFIAFLFLNHLINNKIDKKKFIIVSASVSLLFFLFYLLPNTWFNFFNTNEIQYFNSLKQNYVGNSSSLNQIEDYKSIISDIRVSIFKKDCLRSLLFILLTSGIVYAFIIEKIKRVHLFLILGVIVIADLWSVDKRYLNNDKNGSKYEQWVDAYKYKNPFTAIAADRFILEQEIKEFPELKERINSELNSLNKPANIKAADWQTEQDKISFRELNFATNYRVLSLNNPFSESRTSYFHKSIGGYHGAKLKIYQEMIEFYISDEMASIIDVLQSNPTDEKIDSLFKYETPVLNMLNTKYIIYNNDAPPIINQYCMGNAWFANDIKLVNNADEEILSINELNQELAVVQKKQSSTINQTIKSDSSAQISLIKYLPNHLTYKSVSSENQVAIFSEIFYKAGWNAYINNKPAGYFKANYFLRGINIPKGDNIIEFKFTPKSYYLGRRLSGIGSVLIILFIFGIIVYEVKARKRTETQDNV
ncbi:YfhO family protein [Saccharicrinis aurantiacus]|uniref:YfhO family protein n=1 Tax=Saccharicrinis aurantiacus TaxID=1849719 RepID=UPI0008393EDA|nr:YfhO family protein [Saccharicrinis aurantiacus]